LRRYCKSSTRKARYSLALQKRYGLPMESHPDQNSI
jgi:hypothetical protein